MYDRALRRVCADAVGSTSPAVGPGSYQPKLPKRGISRANSYAPFLSMAPRETFLTIRGETVIYPGPAKYNPRFSRDSVKGGRVLSNRERRFMDRMSDTPGPGSYRLARWGDRRAKLRLDGANNGGQLIKSHIIYDIRGQPPSVPSPGQATGYEESNCGLLQKTEALSKDTSMGPAYYNVKNSETKTTGKYKGVFFAKQTGNRMDFKGRQGPGPGDYDVAVPVGTSYGETAPLFESNLPRYHELVVKVEEKKAVPGPGKYELLGQFDELVERCRVRTSLPHPAFGSQTSRFEQTELSFYPSPGSYDEPRNALDVLKKSKGLQKSPFGQTSARFVPEHHIRETPGPGTYSHCGMGVDSLRLAFLTRTRGGVFGSTAIRTVPMTTKQQAAMPGPGEYDGDPPRLRRHTKLSFTFASQTQRLRPPQTSNQEVPPPGSYETIKAYDRTQCKQERRFHYPERSSFLSSATRFSVVPEIRSAQPDLENPGPGVYEVQTQACGRSALMVTRTQRFKQFMNDVPGPGYYTFPPSRKNTVLKGTFNVTLSNPLAACKRASRSGTADKTDHTLAVTV